VTAVLSRSDQLLAQPPEVLIFEPEEVR